MVRRFVQLVICVLAVTIVVGCAKTMTATYITVVENGERKLAAFQLGEEISFPDLEDPRGMVALFRTTETIPEDETGTFYMLKGQHGKAGEAYVVTKDYKFRKIGEFDLRMSNEQLVSRFTKYR
jgi:hypothetical protein